MTRGLFTWPLVLVLSLKRRTLRLSLRVAQEQTEDAKALCCTNCSHTAGDCQQPTQSRIQRLKDRETLLANELVDLQKRIVAFTRA